jgi:rod shape-determining protein MreC
LFGAGAGATELRFLPPNADVQVGDILVTSGLDGVFLPGLPVAKVIRTDRDSAYSFAHIACEPLAGVERHGLVLVLGRRLVPPLPKSSLAAEAPAPKKGKRRK